MLAPIWTNKSFENQKIDLFNTIGLSESLCNSQTRKFSCVNYQHLIF